MGWQGGFWVQLLGGQGARNPVILVLRERIWNATAVSLVLPAFNDTGSLDSPPSKVVYPPGSSVSPWVTASRFPAGNKETELKHTISFHSFFFP